MSGIYGAWIHDPSARLDGEVLARMHGALSIEAEPPGPVSGNRGLLGPIGLGATPFHGRSSGIARIATPRGDCAIAFHGTVYNGPELEAGDAPHRGVEEDVLNGFLREGLPFLRRIRGEFALAIWDGTAETLILAVDRFRVHSLVYYLDDRTFVFASRMRALLASGFVRDRQLLPDAVSDLTGSSVIPTPRTIFRRVYKLPPAHSLVCRGRETRLERYWDIDFTHPAERPVADLAREIRAEFSGAIAARLSVDRDPSRLGTFLSGGIDSSTVTGVLAQQLHVPVKSFSIGFGEGRFNEMDYARIAARTFQVEHHEYFVTPADVLEAIPVVIDHFDEPFANASAIPTHFCARLARDHGVDVLYAGDGGDELFAGNERYGSRHVYDPYLRLPRWFRDPVLRPLVGVLARRTGFELFQKAQRFVERACLSYPERIAAHGFLRIVPMGEIFEPGFLETLDAGYGPSQMIAHHYEAARAITGLDRELYLDLKITISDNDVPKVVRMTEAAGVTVRFPFLDDRFAELAARVPARHKLHGSKLRVFFKNAYADLLPEQTRTKRKHGFGLPISVWLRTDPRLHGLMQDIVRGTSLRSRGIFRPKALEDLVAKHATDTTSFYGTILWNLMILELWLRKHA